MKHEILANGNLKIVADFHDRSNLQILKEERGEDFQSDQTMVDVLDSLLANSELQWGTPEEIGALPAAPILKTEDQNGNILKAWGFMGYEVTSPQDELMDKGFAIWTIGWDAEPAGQAPAAPAPSHQSTEVKTSSFNLESALERRKRGAPSSVGKIEPAIVGKNWKKNRKMDTRLLPVHRYTEAQVETEGLVTPQTDPQHDTVGHYFAGPTLFNDIGKSDAQPPIYYCDSYDPRMGYWMTEKSNPSNRRNVSERAIGRTYRKAIDRGLHWWVQDWGQRVPKSLTTAQISPAHRLGVPTKVHCDQCQLTVIQGVPCHETGCPKSYINPATEQPYPIACFQCGCDYIPEGRVHRTNAICPDCANPQSFDEGESQVVPPDEAAEREGDAASRWLRHIRDGRRSASTDYKPGDPVDVREILMSGGQSGKLHSKWIRGFKFVRYDEPGVSFTGTMNQKNIIAIGPVVGGEGEVRFNEQDVRPAELRSVQVWFSDGNHLNTNMAIGITDKEIRDYYAIGRTFNLGANPEGKEDNMVQVTEVRILD